MRNIQQIIVPYLSRYRIMLVCCLLLLLTAVIYGQTIHYGFIQNWDDGQYIHNNPLVVDGVNPQAIKKAFTSFHFSNWHPLTWLSHSVDVEWYGLNPAGHHLTNVLFHGLNSILLFLLLFWLTGAFFKCALVAMLFCVHPLHVESVAWIAERKDVLSTFFLLLTLLAYVWYVHKPQVMRYCTVLLLFAMAMMSKQMVVTLPFLLLLLDAWPLNRFTRPGWAALPGVGVKRSWRYLLVEKVPLFAISITGSIIVIFAQASGDAIQTVERFPLDVRLFNALNAYWLYLWKTIAPYNLSFLYPYAKVTGAQLAVSGLAFLVITYFAIHTVKHKPWFLVGWLWYLGTLVPVIGLVQVGVQPMADRYTYITLIGVFIMLAWGLFDKSRPTTTALVWGGVVVMLTVVSFAQVKVWSSAEHLFAHAARVTPNNDRAYGLLALELEQQGRYTEAVEAAKQAIAINPRRRIAYTTIGNSLRQLGRSEEAVGYYEKVLSIHPDYLDAQFQLASTFMALGQPQQAIEWFMALIKAPEAENAVGLRVNLGIALEQTGRRGEALEQYQAAITMDPDTLPARYNLALLLEKTNQPEMAMAQYAALLRLRPDHLQGLIHLGVLMVRHDQQSEALALFQRVLQIDAENATARQYLALLRNQAE